MGSLRGKSIVAAVGICAVLVAVIFGVKEPETAKPVVSMTAESTQVKESVESAVESTEMEAEGAVVAAEDVATEVLEESQSEPAAEESESESAEEESEPDPTAEESVPESAAEESVPESTVEESVQESAAEESEPELAAEESVPEPTAEESVPAETSAESEQEMQPEEYVCKHEFQKSVWETATCLKGGFYNNVCQRCGLVESVTEEPLPHDVEDIVVQEGNCMEDTVISHVCRNCGQQVQSDTRYTPLNHSWVEGNVDGSTVSYCQWCGVVQ